MAGKKKRHAYASDSENSDDYDEDMRGEEGTEEDVVDDEAVRGSV